MRAITQSNENPGDRLRLHRSRFRAGFTLVELLVVIALTAILLTVIFVPLVNSYALTSKADTQILGQATARTIMSQVSNLLKTADFIYDNAVTTQKNAQNQTITGSEINLWLVDSAGVQYAKPTNFAMLEAVTPARQLDQSGYTYDSSIPGFVPVPIDPTTNEPIYDPLLPPGLSGYQLPLAPGRILTRIFVGLINNTSIPNPNSVLPSDAYMPSVAYSNQYENPQATFNNRYTLYRAEVTAYIQDPAVSPATPSTPYVPNLGLFHTVNATTGAVTDSKSDTLRLHDPNFFYDNSPAGGNAATSTTWAVKGWVDLNHDGICQISENWAALATSMVPKDRVDMVALDRNPDTNAIQYYDNTGQPNATGKPNARTLAVFKPTYVQNDIAVPTSLDNSGNETPNALSSTYMTQYGHWTRPYRVTVYRTPNGGNPLNPPSPPNLEYYVAVGAYSGDTRIFHATNQAQGATPPTFPGAFPDVGPQPDPTTGAFTNLTAPFGFTVNADKGTINFAYSSGVLVNSGSGGTPPYQPLPQRYDPAAIDSVDPGRRYIDLRAALPTPLNPPTAVSPLSTASPWYSDVHIVAGSELVYGPDQLPGPHYGSRIRYTRVSSVASAVGPNQYRINYENNSNPVGNLDPSLYLGYIEFQQGLDPNPTVPDDPTNGVFKSIVLPTKQIDFSTPNSNKAADNVEVSYSFTMVRPNDIVKVDYMTRDLMNVAMEVRLYDAHTGQPQIISLSDKIKVRNLQH